jgi:MGT family glycosyltransferase
MGKGLMFNIPAYGHVYPTLPVAAELVRRGESIHYFASERQRSQIQATGATFTSYESISDTVREIFNLSSSESPSIMTLFYHLLQSCEKLLPHIQEIVHKERPDYIVHDFMTPWGHCLSELFALPTIATVPSLVVNRRNLKNLGLSSTTRILKMLFGRDFFKYYPRFQHTARRISREYNVEKMTMLNMINHYGAFNIVFTSRYFQPCAEECGKNFVFVGPSLSKDVNKLDFPLNFGPGPFIYISLGTLFNLEAGFYKTCFEAFKDMEAHVILAVGKDFEIDCLGPIPTNFVVKQFVPQLEILQNADVFLTHGGLNSVSGGITFGVPMIVVPQSADQFQIAERLQELNAGYIVHKSSASPHVLRRNVRRILTDTRVRANIATIARSFQQAGGHKKAADEILNYMERQSSKRAQGD